jgi:photosystem II stability/assembly factor-like uncharacterized protein
MSSGFIPSNAELLTSGYTQACAYGSALYAIKTNKVAKSTNGGSTWTDFDEVFDQTLHSVFAAKTGTLFAAGDTKIWRSADDGATWALVSTNAAGYTNGWAWAQEETGDKIFRGEYSLVAIPCVYVWVSADDGATWTRKDGLSALADKHVHVVFVDPETDRLYATIGDTPKETYYSDDDGDTWTQIFAARAAGTGFTGITSDATTRYFSDDLLYGNNQITKTTNDSDLSIAYMPPWEYNVSYGTIVLDDATGYLYCTWYNEAQNDGQKASIMRSTDGGSTWTVIASALSGGYKFSFPVVDYRHRIPSELRYLICSCTPDTQLIKLPL